MSSRRKLECGGRGLLGHQNRIKLKARRERALTKGQRCAVYENFFAARRVDFAVVSGQAILRKRQVCPPCSKICADSLSHTEDGDEMHARNLATVSSRFLHWRLETITIIYAKLGRAMFYTGGLLVPSRARLLHTFDSAETSYAILRCHHGFSFSRAVHCSRIHFLS